MIFFLLLFPVAAILLIITGIMQLTSKDELVKKKGRSVLITGSIILLAIVLIYFAIFNWTSFRR